MHEPIDRAPLPIARDHRWLQKSRHSPAAARQLLRDFLSRVDGGERFVDNGELLVTELVTNAVLHGTRPGQRVHLELEVDPDRLWIAVEDASSTHPVLQESPDGCSGRGLLLVETLSEKWGWGPREGVGKRVWCSCPPDC